MVNITADENNLQAQSHSITISVSSAVMPVNKGHNSHVRLEAVQVTSLWIHPKGITVVCGEMVCCFMGARKHVPSASAWNKGAELNSGMRWKAQRSCTQ
jgi:hypothetical protein